MKTRSVVVGCVQLCVSRSARLALACDEALREDREVARRWYGSQDRTELLEFRRRPD